VALIGRINFWRSDDLTLAEDDQQKEIRRDGSQKEARWKNGPESANEADFCLNEIYAKIVHAVTYQHRMN
jgi:hypothetical protein